jgi:hypothetical protein
VQALRLHTLVLVEAVVLEVLVFWQMQVALEVAHLLVEQGFAQLLQVQGFFIVVVVEAQYMVVILMAQQKAVVWEVQVGVVQALTGLLLFHKQLLERQTQAVAVAVAAMKQQGPVVQAS